MDARMCTPVKKSSSSSCGGVSSSSGGAAAAVACCVVGRRKNSVDSPFRLMPNTSTPPSRLMKIRNPFEAHLTQKLHSHLISPNIMVSKKLSTPTINDKKKFKWNIDEISTMKPADIDESSLQQHESFEDPALESFAQASIDKFFSMKEIVPSPFTQAIKNQPLLKPRSRIAATKEEDQDQDEEEDLTMPLSMKDCSTQTMLTLPMNLPPELEEALKPYFTYNQDFDDKEDERTNSKVNSLYRKLFHFDEEEEDDDENKDNLVLIQDGEKKSMSPIRMLSPPRFVCFEKVRDDGNNLRRCDFGTPSAGCGESGNGNGGRGGKFEFLFDNEDFGLSPICPQQQQRQEQEESDDGMMMMLKSRRRNVNGNGNNKSIGSLNFTVQMSLDCSADVEGVVPNSLNFEDSFEVVPMEEGSQSNWEEAMNKSPSTPSSKGTNSGDEMDVSNSNTPHSRIFSSSRKKLSDSFLSAASGEDDEQEQESHEKNERQQQMSNQKVKVTTNCDSENSDQGYQTANYSQLLHTNFTASTPTKNLKQQQQQQYNNKYNS